MNQLSTELLDEILNYVDLQDLGVFASINVLFRRLCSVKLLKKFSQTKVRVAVRQGHDHLCAEFTFASYNFLSNTITWQTNASHKQFNSNLFSSSPLLRYLKITNPYSTSGVALSRPVTLPVKKNGTFTRSGYNFEVVIDYAVSSEGMRINQLQTHLRVLNYKPVPESHAMNFPPASFTGWLKYQLCEPEAKHKDNARFRSAIPWQPVVNTNQHHEGKQTGSRIKTVLLNLRSALTR